MLFRSSPLKSSNGAMRWVCKCDCGQIIHREGQQLRSGYAFSCGCTTRRMKNAVGQRFGRLLVVQSIGKTKHKSQIVSCLCDCGNTHNVVLSALVQNLVVSCGCLHSEIVIKRNKDAALADGVASFNSLYGRYKSCANKRGLVWELNQQQFAELTQKNCYYCNAEPHQIIKAHGCKSSYTYNGVDRIDSSTGYTLSNCVSACGRCNIAKNNMTGQEFKTMIKKIYDHWGNK